MEWTRCLKEVIRYVEKNLSGDIDIGDIAQSVYMSPFYLQKGFQILTGYSFGEYVRNRRLYEAALDISHGEKIIETALKYGYESQESFTKAFTRFHGATPGSVRRDIRLARLFLPLNIHIEITGGEKMNYTVSPVWGFKVIGFEKEFTYENAYKEIPEFWDEICEKYCTHTIYAGKSPSCPEEQAIIDNCIGEYGVCIDDIGNGKFRYLIAGKYTGGNVPDSMTLYEFPQGEWAKFDCIGPMPEALQTVNTYIFKEWLPGNPDFEMSGCYNIEWYSCDGNKTDADYRSAIWIPVRRYSEEAQRMWGNTPQYKESAAKTAKRSKADNDRINAGMMDIFRRLGDIKDNAPSSVKAGELIRELQEYITEYFYECTDEILASLGETYVSDSRFAANIDRMGGEGCAKFVSDAIKEYLK